MSWIDYSIGAKALNKAKDVETSLADRVQTDVPADAVFTDTISAEHYNQEDAPSPSSSGATWYVPSTGVTYKWLNDGDSDIWVDISTAGTGISAAYVDAKDALKANIESPTFTGTVSGIDAVMVGAEPTIPADTYEAYDATILKEADIGSKVLALDGDGSELTGLQSPLVEGTDYLAPNGDASQLVNLPASGISYTDIGGVDGVISGLAIPTSSDLISTLIAGSAFVEGVKVEVQATEHTYTAEKDTYVDLQADGSLVYTEVGNGDATPAKSGTNLRLARVETDADNITDSNDIVPKSRSKLVQIKDTSIAISSDGSALANDDGSDNKNIAFGSNAGKAITTGVQNFLAGKEAGSRLTTTYSVIAIGGNALKGSSTSSNYSIGIGYNAGQAVSGSLQSVFIGYNSGYSTTTGDDVVALGYASCMYNTTGSNNIGLGKEALIGNSSDKLTGSYNIGVGYQTGYSLTTGQYNVLQGYRAGYSLTSDSYNVMVGKDTGAYIDGGYNVLIGGANKTSGSVGTANNNVIAGHNAGSSLLDGTFNVFIGQASGYSITNGVANTAVGRHSGGKLSTGGYNTHVGYYAGRHTDSDQSVNLETFDNTVCLGRNSYATASGEMSLGNSDYITEAYTAVAFTTRSDERLKDFVEMDLGLDFINALEPKKYTWNDGADKESINYGFSAQQVKRTLDGSGVEGKTKMHLVRGQTEDATQNLTYTEFIAPLTKAIQELSQKMTEMQQEINELKDK